MESPGAFSHFPQVRESVYAIVKPEQTLSFAAAQGLNAIRFGSQATYGSAV
jgi:hypothetical protein